MKRKIHRGPKLIAVLLTIVTLFTLWAPAITAMQAMEMENTATQQKWQEILDADTQHESSPYDIIRDYDLDIVEDHATEFSSLEEVNQNYCTDRFIVRFAQSSSNKRNYGVSVKNKIAASPKDPMEIMASAKKSTDVEIVEIKDIETSELQVLITENAITADQLIQKLESESVEVSFIQPDFPMQVSSDITEIPEGEPFERIRATDTNTDLLSAWEISEGDGVIVAVFDTGLEITHGSLSDNIYVNNNEIPENGIDDDGNGYIDDITGWDFFNKCNAVNDINQKYDQWHATYIAGLIAGKNTSEFTGVAPNAKILPLKVFQGGVAYTSDIIEAIAYAESMGAQIANFSFVTYFENPELRRAMEDSSMLFVCAAGNNFSNLSETCVYPAIYQLPNVVTVGSVDNDDRLSRFSNYSEEAVDIAAPGTGIISASINNGTTVNNGTSVSTAFVSGVAALLLGKDPAMGAGAIKNRIMASGDIVTGLEGKIRDGKRLNAGWTLSNRQYNNTVIVADDPTWPFTNAGHEFNDGSSYQLAGNSQKEMLAPMPTARHGLSVVAVGKKIYAIGGQTSLTGGYTNKVEVYDPATNEWATLSGVPSAITRSYFGAAVVDEKIYVFGGYNGSYLSSTYMYDPATNNWTQKANMPKAITQFGSSAANNGHIYICGGFDGYNQLNNTYK